MKILKKFVNMFMFPRDSLKIEYSIYKVEDISYAGCKRHIVRVVIEKNPVYKEEIIAVKDELRIIFKKGEFAYAFYTNRLEADGMFSLAMFDTKNNSFKFRDKVGTKMNLPTEKERNIYKDYLNFMLNNGYSEKRSFKSLASRYHIPQKEISKICLKITLFINK